jgi:3',5'-cyclic AMP phosphodiesterase CpdA
MRIIQFSDTHISHLGGLGAKNVALLADYINEVVHPDLVINTGDIVLLNPDSMGDREFAFDLHRRINAPLRVVPGNHDVGEAGDKPWMGLGVTGDRVAAFRRTWGPDRFLELGRASQGSANWAFVGISSEVLSTGVPQEAEQWEWLAAVAAQVRGMSVILFLHKPLWLSGGSREGITVAGPARDRILSTFAGAHLRVVGNGHVHRYHSGFEGDVHSVWAPSLTFAPNAEPEHGFGPGESGVVEYVVDDDTVEARFRTIPGVQGSADFYSMPEVGPSLDEVRASATA